MTSMAQEADRVRELEDELARLRADLDAARAEAPLLKTLLRDIAERQEIEGRLRETQEWLHLAQADGDQLRALVPNSKL